MSKRQQNTLFIVLDDLILADHPYRKLDALLSFDELVKPYVNLYSVKGRKEKGGCLWLTRTGFTIHGRYERP